MNRCAPGQCLADRYRLDREIGTGSLATVWLATDLVLQRAVAVKVLHRHLTDDETAAPTLLAEARPAAKLQLPGIVPIYDSVTDSGVTALVMEYVPGPTLRSYLAGHELDVHTAIGIVAQLADTLHAAHLVRVMHGDLRPENVLLELPGPDHLPGDVPTPRITDFGIAALSDSSITEARSEGSGYRAPELVAGAFPDPRTDTFALGVVLYEALTRRLPWPTPSSPVSEPSTLRVEPLPLRQFRAEIPRELESVVLRAIATDPDKRFASIAEFRAALLATDPGAPEPVLRLARADVDPSGFLQSEKGWLVPTMLIALVVVALLAALVAFGQSDAGRALVDRARGNGTGPSTTTPRVEPVTARAVRVTALAYDLLGDGKENDHLAPFAVDGSIDSVDLWRSECYPAGFESVGKPGVGLILSSATPIRFEGIDIYTNRPGWSADVYVSGAPAALVRQDRIEQWGEPLARIDAANVLTEVRFPAVEGRTMVLFFTSLDGVAVDDCFGEHPGSRRIEVIEARPIGID